MIHLLTYLFLFIFSFSLFAQDEDIWKEIFSGSAKIDTENDQGGPLVPVKRTIVDAQGRTQIVHIQIVRDYAKMVEIPSFFTGNALSDGEYCGPPQNVHDLCKFLSKPVDQWITTKERECFDALRKEVGGDVKPLDHEKVLRAMYALNDDEQEFLASVITAYGESRSSNENETLLVLRSMENRLDLARRYCPSANLMDIALQPLQYSLWNSNDSNWKQGISLASEEYDEKDQLKRSIKIYKRLKAGRYSVHTEDQGYFDGLTHFRTKSLVNVPSWGRSENAIVSLRVNDTQLGSGPGSVAQHYFFYNVATVFRFRDLRPMRPGEDICYR